MLQLSEYMFRIIKLAVVWWIGVTAVTALNLMLIVTDKFRIHPNDIVTGTNLSFFFFFLSVENEHPNRVLIS